MRGVGTDTVVVVSGLETGAERRVDSPRLTTCLVGFRVTVSGRVRPSIEGSPLSAWVRRGTVPQR